MKGNKRMRMVTLPNPHATRVVPEPQASAMRIELSSAMSARYEVSRISRRLERAGRFPVERRSVERAMIAIEQRLVQALWTLARLPNDRGVGFASRNGIGYLDERSDLYANAVANGGWLTTAPRPSPPSARAIDAMHEPLDWLRLIERSQAKLLTEGAMSRRGDMANPVRWSRIRKNLSMEHLTIRTLQRRYEQALRDLVTEITQKRLNDVANVVIL